MPRETDTMSMMRTGSAPIIKGEWSVERSVGVGGSLNGVRHAPGGTVQLFGNSSYGRSFRNYSRSEQDAVRGAMNMEVVKDLRAVHYELGRDVVKMESDIQRMTRTGLRLQKP
eukprot:TRINITY_DN14945_c1_g2_i3.p6 TRINITY_DN14945_c1_g2~~TRINITY_DN14945_c1_g2_i3.p6  ORF type:complete len:113 (+),score=22.26 TRINITY_DN14945_c1_g2_i3:234-572(+)